jgi:hypothetical protein
MVHGLQPLAMRLDNRAGYTPLPQDERYEFTHNDQQAFIFVMWLPKQKRNTTAVIQLYDLDNKLLFVKAD